MSIGGSNGSTQQQSQSTQGFQALSPQIQQVFNTLASQAGNYLQGGSQSGSTTGMYTPIPQTSGETQAINTINQGFNPNQSQLNSSINEQMNPYNQDVINQINKQAYGQNSVLQGQLASQGQFGSNRAALGANDIAGTQASEIGSLLNPEYNTAVNNALTTIPGLNEASSAAQLQGGQFQRNLGLQTSQAPVTALQSIAQILGILPTNSGQSTSSGSGNTTSGQFNLFSDDNLKENIESMGKKNGFSLYKFNYKGGIKKFIGVLASEIEKKMPEAVMYKDGYRTIDYQKIGIPMRLADG